MKKFENPDKREMFTAIYKTYSCEVGIRDYINLYDVRTRKGDVVKDILVFASDEVEDMPMELVYDGEPVAFLADLEFKNVKFYQLMEEKDDE